MGPVKRSLTLQGHRTSVSLEPEFWDALKRLAAARDQSVNALAAEIDAERSRRAPSVALSSAIRVRLLEAARNNEC